MEKEDLFIKRFIYYLATGIFIFAVAIVLLLFFVEIPEKNKDVVNFILGVVVGTGLTGVFQYFFGSSKGSKDKQNELFKLK
jgi:drug/metabolite transporter (DMT)-like permease